MKKQANVLSVLIVAILMVASLAGCPKQMSVNARIMDKNGQVMSEYNVTSGVQLFVPRDGSVQFDVTNAKMLSGEIIVNQNGKLETFPLTIDPAKLAEFIKTFEADTDLPWLALGGGVLLIITGTTSADGSQANSFTLHVDMLEADSIAVSLETNRGEFHANLLADDSANKPAEGENHHKEGEIEGEKVAETYTLATSVQGQGQISPVSGTYDAGEVVQVAATPASGWHFGHWTVNGASGTTDPQAQITMDSDVQLVAVFVQNTTPPVEGEGETPVDTRGKVVVNLTTSGGAVTFTATAPDGYSYGTFGGVGTAADIGSVGLNLFYLIPRGGAWSARETFPFNGTWPVSGVMTKLSGSTLRFEVVANGSGCWGDPEKLVVKLNGTLVPRVADEAGNVAYQVQLPS